MNPSTVPHTPRCDEPPWYKRQWSSIFAGGLWIAAISAWLLFVAGLYAFGGAWSRSGVFGDSFGVFNAFVAALAAAAAYKAFRSASGECVIEFDNGSGASLRVHLRGCEVPDVVALGRSFLGVD